MTVGWNWRQRLVSWAALTLWIAGCTVKPIAGDFALTHLTVIDGTGKAPAPNMTVVVKGEQIVKVAGDKDVRLATGTTTIDMTGKYVVPASRTCTCTTPRTWRPRSSW